MYNYAFSIDNSNYLVCKGNIERLKKTFNRYEDIEIRTRAGRVFIETTKLYCVIFNLLAKLHRDGKVSFKRKSDKERLINYINI